MISIPSFVQGDAALIRWFAMIGVRVTHSDLQRVLSFCSPRSLASHKESGGLWPLDLIRWLGRHKTGMDLDLYLLQRERDRGEAPRNGWSYPEWSAFPGEPEAPLYVGIAPSGQVATVRLVGEDGATREEVFASQSEAEMVAMAPHSDAAQYREYREGEIVDHFRWRKFPVDSIVGGTEVRAGRRDWAHYLGMRRCIIEGDPDGHKAVTMWRVGRQTPLVVSLWTAPAPWTLPRSPAVLSPSVRTAHHA